MDDDVAVAVERLRRERSIGLSAVAFRAYRELEVGGLIVGDVPTFRTEQMPYGGVEKSGIGRERVRSAME